MTKIALNVRIANMTRKQIDALCEKENLTAGEVVMMAVDRMHRETFPPQEKLAETYNDS